MKKIILIFLCLCLCGCRNTKYEISEINWDEIVGLVHANGTVKNNSSKNCETLFIRLEYKSGSLKEQDLCIVHNLSAKETKDFKCLYTGDIKNIETYSIKVKSVECTD